jgi:hypothetical protein
MKVFGPIKVRDIIEVVDTPTGETCPRCSELIAEGDSGYLVPHLAETLTERAHHRECFLRSIFGSVAHQKEECSCFGGDHEDDPNLTVRENAQASERYFLMHPPKEPA